MISLPQNWRNTDPITSEEAGRAAGDLSAKHHIIIYEALREIGRPAAAEEVGEYLDWSSYHPIGRRLHELVKMGLIERTEERHINRSGRGAFRYQVVTL